MNAAEAQLFHANGYLVRNQVFAGHECMAMIRDCEMLVAALRAEVTAPRSLHGSVECSISDELETTLKWEHHHPEVISGVEIFAHLSDNLASWAADPRLTDVCREACGSDGVTLFTEKLNLKRARAGGAVTPHRDGPHWEPFVRHVPQIVTAMIYLDEATRDNGCLEVASGSHVRSAERADMIFLEAPAGSVIWFGPYLEHRSPPNRSDHDRRALLLSYQPAGNEHQRVLLRAVRDRVEHNRAFLREARARRAQEAR